MVNQNPEQKVRDCIDRQLAQAGWAVQDKNAIDFNAGRGIAVREYQTDVGPADYVLFVDKVALGVIEAKAEDWGHKITTVELQSQTYAAANLKWVAKNAPLPYVYESTGVITRFTNGRDPNPRSREVFNFHHPETLAAWQEEPDTLRKRLQTLPPLNHEGLRACQVTAIEKLEESFKQDKPRALVQMATGSGKTYTAISSVYRLLKHARAQRILFLVDTKNLGEQAEQEFMAYLPNDDNRKFTELYTVQRLKSSFVAQDSQVCISTIQRMYSLLKGEALDEATEEENPAEHTLLRKEPLPVVYNSKIPPEFFDFIVIDECHRSIYNLWRQVIEYFDAYLIGLTATPDNRTYGFFKKNVVSEYDHEKAVADGVNVGNEIYVIETERTKQGGTLTAKQQVEKRERLTRKKRWEIQDEDDTYTATQLDRDIVNPDQIRTVVRTFKDKLPDIFPGRQEVPKTLIFAKTDSHADDIIHTVREEFGEGNEFCKKITYKIDEDPKSVLAQFRNDYHPRIAVTVDMIATGTDVKPLECLLFMRDVKSRNYFEQMKGRGTRTEWDGDTTENAKALTQEFADYLKEHQNDIDALSIYFQTPARRAEVSYDMVKTLLDQLRQDRPKLAPQRVWQAYAHLENYQGENPVSDLTALVALIRRVTGLDDTLSTYNNTVRRNFQRWILQHHSGAGEKFNEAQMAWLHMIRDHVISSFHMERDDLEMAPFDAKGGMGKMYQLFGDRMDEVIDELNRELVA